MQALSSLELLVTIDAYMSTTAQLADYILPPTLMYERADLPFGYPGAVLLPNSWSQFAAAVLDRPAGSDLVEDWYPWWALAKRLGVQLEYTGVALDMETAPTTEEILAIRLGPAPISLEELKADLEPFPAGRMYEHPSSIVHPARPDAEAKFDVMPSDVAEEVRELFHSTEMGDPGPGSGFTHLLSSRRTNHVVNSSNTLGQHPPPSAV